MQTFDQFKQEYYQFSRTGYGNDLIFVGAAVKEFFTGTLHFLRRLTTVGVVEIWHPD